MYHVKTKLTSEGSFHFLLLCKLCTYEFIFFTVHLVLHIKHYLNLKKALQVHRANATCVQNTIFLVANIYTNYVWFLPI